jgi:hypothetical protein
MAVTFTLDMPGMTREQLDGLVQQLGAGLYPAGGGRLSGQLLVRLAAA